MKERACLNCQNDSMLAETRPIPRAVRLPLLGNYSIEKYFPITMLGYTHYTVYICKRCGKVEIFMTNQATDVPPDLRAKS
jgi:hypothetical protein